MNVSRENLFERFCIYMTDTLTEADCTPCILYGFTGGDCNMSRFSEKKQDSLYKIVKGFIKSRGYEIEDFIRRVDIRTICAGDEECHDYDCPLDTNCELSEYCEDAYSWFDKELFPPEKIKEIYEEKDIENKIKLSESS